MADYLLVAFFANWADIRSFPNIREQTLIYAVVEHD